MSLVDTLLGRLTRKYDRTAGPVLALRLSYLTGQMTWAIADDVLTTVPSGGVGVTLSVDLTQYTIGSLATFLAAQPGYVVAYLDVSYAGLGAVALAEASGDINTSNGDHLYAGTNPNWALFNVYASELKLARAAIQVAPLEMSTTTADGYWLDYLGSFYAVPRELGEPDQTFGPRIAAEVLLPRQNNTAIEIALRQATSQQAVCTDAVVFGNPLPVFDGAIAFSGAPHFFNASAARIYNLFDVAIGYALTGRQTPADYLSMVRRQIDRLRAAGTHLRRLTLAPSVMADAVRAASERFLENWTQASLLVSAASVISADIALAVLNDLIAAGTVSRDVGVATLAVTSTLSAAFRAASGLGAAPIARTQAAAALLANGGLQASPGATMLVRASFAGAGGLAATPGQWVGAATFNGASALAASPSTAKFGAAVFVPTGALSADAGVIGTRQGSAALAGQATLQASGAATSNVSARFAGAGGFAAAYGITAQASASFFGTGNATADAIRATLGAGVFVPSGSLVAAASTTHPVQATAVFAAIGAWGNAFSAEFSNEFGSGLVATISTQTKSASAAFAGAGAWGDPFSPEFSAEFGEGLAATRVAPLPGTQFASASLPARGGMVATGTARTLAQATFTGAGGMVATISTVSGAATFLAASGLAASGGISKRGVAVFVPSGGFNAAASTTHPVLASATFTAFGAWSDAFSVEFSNEFGSGLVATISTQTKSASATFAGSGAWGDPFSPEFSAEFGEGLVATRVGPLPGTQFASASLPAIGAKVATAGVRTNASAGFAASGTLAAFVAAQSGSAAFPASAALAATAGANRRGVGVFVPAGGFSAAASLAHFIFAAASFGATAGLTDPFSVEFSPEFGGGLVATVTQTTKSGAATFAGSGVWGEPFSPEFSTEFGEGIFATRVPAGPGPRAGSASLQGNALLQSTVRVRAQASATLSGAGVLSATVNQVPATASLPGAGSLSADGTVRRAGTGIFVPAGGLSAFAVVTRFVSGTASFTAAGGLLGPVPWTSDFAAVFGSSGAGPLAVVLPPPPLGSLSAAGTFTASAVVRTPGAASLTATGGLSATADHLVPGAAAFISVGNLFAPNPWTSDFAGVFGGGGLNAAVMRFNVGAASFAGEGVLSGASPWALDFTGAFGTGGGLDAAVTRPSLVGTASFAATGGLSADASVRRPGVGIFVPAGGFSATGRRAVSGAASFAATGGWSGRNSWATDFAAVFGSGGLSATKIP